MIRMYDSVVMPKPCQTPFNDNHHESVDVAIITVKFNTTPGTFRDFR
jgi:hypothetical protein